MRLHYGDGDEYRCGRLNFFVYALKIFEASFLKLTLL